MTIMKYIEEDIKEILIKAKQGDERSINQFIQIHEALNRYMVSNWIYNSRTHFNQEELEPIGLMGVYKGIESYDESRGSLKNHIAFKITTELKNWVKSNSYVVRADKRYVQSQETTDTFDETFEIDNTYENNDNRSHLRDILDKNLSKLNDREKSVLKGLYFDELKYTELSEQMDIPLGTIYSIERAALKKMKINLTS